jgi:hypothetical protein
MAHRVAYLARIYTHTFSSPLIICLALAPIIHHRKLE